MPTTDHDVSQDPGALDALEETKRNAKLTTEATSHGLSTRASRPPFRRGFLECHLAAPPSLSGAGLPDLAAITARFLHSLPVTLRPSFVSTLFACDPSPQSSPLFHSPHLAQPPLTHPQSSPTHHVDSLWAGRPRRLHTAGHAQLEGDVHEVAVQPARSLSSPYIVNFAGLAVREPQQ